MTSLAALQNQIKRDPSAYRDDFLLQFRHFESQLKIFQLKPSKEVDTFQEQINFLSNVASCYPEEMKEFPSQLSQLLENHAYIMKPEVRKDLVQCVILLRNRGFIQPLALLSLLFKLFRVPDKPLRAMLYRQIISDLRNINLKHRNNKVNNTLQNFMFTMLQDTSEIAAKKSHEVMIELYKRNIWNDAKTVNAISTGIFSKNSKIIVATCKFFLGGSDETVDSDDEEEKPTVKDVKIKFRAGIHKKSKRRARNMEEAMKKLRKKDMKRKDNYNFAAIELLNDPQGYSERVFNLCRRSTERFEVRLMMLNLVSRLIGYHKLLIENFYPYIKSYLTSKQQNITYILAIAAQACHDLLPPDVLQPVIMEVANNFVSDRANNEVIAIGLNTIREMCQRTPLVMTEELMSDLALYKNYKDKGVVMAALSLINFYREKNPHILEKKHRGRDYDPEAKLAEYGASNVAESVDGADLLEMYGNKSIEEIENMKDEDDDDDEEGEDMEEGEEGEEEEDEEEEVEMEDEKKNLKRKVPDDEDENGEEEAEDKEDEERDVKKRKTKEDDGEKAEEAKSEDASMESEEKKPKLSLAATRIFDDADFDMIKKLKAEEMKKTARARNRDRDDRAAALRGEDDEEEDLTALIDPSSLLSKKHKKMNKDERMESIREGRTDRDYRNRFEKFKANKNRGTTNKEKEINKPFMLVKHKPAIREKVRKSLKEKQQIKNAHMKLMKNQKKYKH